jgi:hypothetical protein
MAIYAYGTNTGIHAITGGARQQAHSEGDVRYVRRRYGSGYWWARVINCRGFSPWSECR